MKKSYYLKSYLNIILSKFLKKLELFRKAFYISFIEGHNSISNKDIKRIKKFKHFNDSKIINRYEKKFAELIGDGKCFSFAAARMGFYELLKFNELKKGDEVILLGFTCAVMANAIIKTGAKIIFSDIDINNFGSNPNSIESLITKKTKIIVAQHSFGIPCEIAKIKAIAQRNKIFLIEDCSLTLGSKIEDKVVGSFGDAAIFSTDHTKPLNTITGGIVYTAEPTLIKYLKLRSNKYPELNYKNKEYLWNVFIFERFFCNPLHNGKVQLLKPIFGFIIPNFKLINNELVNDNLSTPKSRKTYPAKLPTFCALIGLKELEKWERVSKERITYLKKFIELSNELNLVLPKSYFDKRLMIIPLRLIWIDKKKNANLKNLRNFLDTESFWFKKPLIGTNESLKNFNYKRNFCRNSELINPFIRNLPCAIESRFFEKMLNCLRVNCSKET